MNKGYEYLAYYKDNDESDIFSSFEEAEKWLKSQYVNCASDGYSEETVSGGDYIAKITHRSKFVETENREKDGYKWNEEASGYFIDGNPDNDEWIYDHDIVGKIIFEEITGDKS